jgi:hypothetical protein
MRAPSDGRRRSAIPRGIDLQRAPPSAERTLLSSAVSLGERVVDETESRRLSASPKCARQVSWLRIVRTRSVFPRELSLSE